MLARIHAHEKPDLTASPIGCRPGLRAGAALRRMSTAERRVRDPAYNPYSKQIVAEAKPFVDGRLERAQGVGRV